jgi:flavin reductase (DIM6/NTAB) family NADH-FMN oxidoreductase RutF
MAVGVDDFKKALQLWASGVSVVTTQSEKFGVQGMTVTAFSSVSINPPQILVCINESADTGEGIDESQNFAVNILNSDQQDVSNQFAGGCSQEQRFKNTTWKVGITGAPILEDSLMSLDCKVIEKVHAGTHWIIIGEVQECACRSGEPLLYYRGAYQQLKIDKQSEFLGK